MKTITINHKEYKLPESYRDISILKFQELLDLEAASLSEFDKHIHIILAGGDITKFEEVRKQSLISVLNLMSYWKETEDIKNLK